MYLEPGEGKKQFTDDVAEWILRNAKASSQRPTGDGSLEAQSKL